jgi:FtsP/CotA-like multicopper oxidase with cupredoxin domain
MKLYRVIAKALMALVVTAVCGIVPSTASAIDETKVPHYFGPYPNWALSPLPATDANGAVVPGTGIRKFVDGLPGLGASSANNLGQYLPVAVPDTTTYPGSDYYEIAVVQYRLKMHSDLPATLLRGYVQLSTTNVPGARAPLSNALVNGGSVPISSYTGVTAPNYLGPVIAATKNRPVRILFRNLLPAGANGDLFLPVDSTFMGAGMGMMMESYDVTPTTGGSYDDAARNPVCSKSPKDPMCFTDNRVVVHLHGGTTPWISDGTPHQWITPGDETTQWTKGESVVNVPDMPNPGPGAVTLYYTNQQSARLMFYHDHAWGTTRLNVYAGAAAGYEITDDTEKALVSSGVIPGANDTIPLIIQDRTFVPTDDQILKSDPAKGKYAQDPTWDKSRWGGFGNLWYHHVYMPAQNPDDPTGLSPYGRWMYGPWFWPPSAGAKYGPIRNPRYNMDPATNFTTQLAKPCNLDDQATWQYQVDPFCEPEMIPGTPNISAGMEQFNDTPIVNGTAYPTTTLEPKPYRLRILNAANDRSFNLQLYVADSSTASSAQNAKGEPIGGTEVALKASELAAAQDDPNVFPTPDTTLSPAGPSWIQIASEGGFLPAPAVIPPQPTTFIIDPTRFDFGNVDKHSLVLAPAERADVIVDFSKYAGKTLILYNDAPAAYPARIASYDYYTGAPDLSPVGAPGVLPGYGPNTRTIMQIKVNAGSGTPFNMTALTQAFAHKANNTGVFESGQHPIIVGQAAYNSAYGTSFASASNCNAPGSTKTSCDGLARISEQGGDLFGFNTLANPTVKMQIPLEPKTVHDEMNSATFDDYGRMTANMGVETVPASTGNQNINLMPYIFPPTEVIDASNLPRTDSMTPLGTKPDGTQIWKITHNGVDTHPLHFHLYDVQVINRVTWDNIIMQPDPNELGWKDTVRVSPLEDTIVALRPVIPVLPFDLPNSVRLLDPTRPDGAPIALASVVDVANLGLIPVSNPDGEPIDLYNHKVNFGAEYVWHCHILSHEEMDMMRPIAVALPPVAPANLTAAPAGTTGNRHVIISWADKSLSETAFEIERAKSAAGPWSLLATVQSTTGPTNTSTLSYTDDLGSDTTGYVYRVRAINVVGDTWNYAAPGTNELVSGGFPTTTAASAYSNVSVLQVPEATGASATFSVPSPQLIGTTVKITGAGQGGTGTYEYKYYVRATGGTFQLLRDWSTSNVYNWNTTGLTAGTYTLQVDVRSLGSTSMYGAWTNYSYTLNVPEATGASATFSVPSPQVIGTTVKITGAGQGGTGTYEYKYYVKSAVGTFQLLRDWSTSNVYNWNTTGLTAGTYTLQVDVRSLGSTSMYGAWTNYSYTVKVYSFNVPEATGASATFSVPSPQLAGTTVKITGAGQGGTGTYEYKYYVKSAGGTFQLLRDWSTSNVYNWNTTGLTAGTYTLQVDVRSLGSTSMYGASTNYSYTVKVSLVNVPEATAASATFSVPSPQSAGTTVKITGAGQGGTGTYEYKYYVKSAGGTFQLLRDWSTSNVYNWNTTGLTAGTYTLQVDVRSVGSTSMYGAWTNYSYAIK